jgi:hypothetical protein
MSGMARGLAWVGLSSLAIWLTPAVASGGDLVVYSEDFESRPGTSYPEWSSSPITYQGRGVVAESGTLAAPAVVNVESPGGVKKRRFLGEFGGPRVDPTARTRTRQTVRLTLKDLAPHAEASVEFDLLVLKSWDGSSRLYGPDRLIVDIKGGRTLLDATFSNNPKVETEGSFQEYPRPRSAPRTGAVAVKTLGYSSFGDSIYHFRFAFPHAADALTVEFAGDLFEGKGTGDESWGLDDVIVRIRGGPDGTPR